MPITLECISPDLLALIEDLPMTTKTKMILQAAPPCTTKWALKVDAVRKLEGEECPPCPTTSSSSDNSSSKKSSGKRKKSAYNVFIGECIKERPEGQAVSERMKTCGPRWKGLPDNEKDKYQTMADRENQ